MRVNVSVCMIALQGLVGNHQQCRCLALLACHHPFYSSYEHPLHAAIAAFSAYLLALECDTIGRTFPERDGQLTW